MLTISILYNNKKYLYNKGTTLLEISNYFQKDFKDRIIVGEINGVIKDLNTPVLTNSVIKFYDKNSVEGNKVYENGLVFILIKAFLEELQQDIRIMHSIDKGIYIKTKLINKQLLDRVKRKMDDIIKNDLPIDKILINKLDAINYFSRIKVDDKVKLLKYNTNSNINLYRLDNLYDYFFFNLPISTGYINSYKLNLIDSESFVLSFPSIYTDKITYKHHEKLFQEFINYSNWCEKLSIRSVSDLNEKISTGKIDDYILLSEMYQNNKLMEIAKTISENKKIKVVLISGPSASGKTTTSKKLRLYLKGFGINTKSLSIDDYFKDRDKTPKKEDGTYDFESINAIDISLFNKHLTKLLSGQRIKIPTFDFIKGSKVYNNYLEIGEDEVLIIEGLHALNNELTKDIDKKNKFKIYHSPLTVLNLDKHNRIKTTDNRLLRRIVRDNKTRGYNASQVLNIWKNVREGEEENIFPYQDDVDVIFNTTLLYEIGVLKTYVEPLLYLVQEKDEFYKDAIRLLNLLKNVLPIPSENIPKDSILREFIGGSYFE